MVAPVLAVPLAFFAGRGLVTSLGEVNTVSAKGVLDGPVVTPTMLPTPSSTQIPGPSVTATPTREVTLVREAAGVTCDGEVSARNQEAATELRRRLGSAVKGGTTKVSFVVHDWAADLTCGYRAEQSYPTASVVKVATVAAVMRKAERAGGSLTAAQRSLARQAIEISSNDAQSSLWSQAGGTSGMQAFFEAAGMDDTKAAVEWGLTETTATDQAALMDAITHGDLLSEENREDLLTLMRGVDPEQDWGISEGAPQDEDVALKNGWYPDGTWRVHSIGYVGEQDSDCDYVLTVLSEDDSTQESGIALVESTASMVHAALAAGRES